MTGGGKEYRLPLPGWIIEKVFSVVDLRQTIERLNDEVRIVTIPIDFSSRFSFCLLTLSRVIEFDNSRPVSSQTARHSSI